MSQICNVATELNKIGKWVMKISTYLTLQTQETGTQCFILWLMKRKYQFLQWLIYHHWEIYIFLRDEVLWGREICTKYWMNSPHESENELLIWLNIMINFLIFRSERLIFVLISFLCSIFDCIKGVVDHSKSEFL